MRKRPWWRMSIAPLLWIVPRRSLELEHNGGTRAAPPQSKRRFFKAASFPRRDERPMACYEAAGTGTAGAAGGAVTGCPVVLMLSALSEFMMRTTAFVRSVQPAMNSASLPI